MTETLIPNSHDQPLSPDQLGDDVITEPTAGFMQPIQGEVVEGASELDVALVDPEGYAKDTAREEEVGVGGVRKILNYFKQRRQAKDGQNRHSNAGLGQTGSQKAPHFNEDDANAPTGAPLVLREEINSAEIITPSAEASPKDKLHSLVAGYLEGGFLQSRIRKLQGKIESDPDLSRIAAFNIYEARNRADLHTELSKGNATKANEIDAEYLAEYSLFKAEVATKKDKIKESNDISHKMRELGYGSVSFESSETEARQILEMFAGMCQSAPGSDAEAPYAGYKSNTSEAWQNVPDKKVRAYLEGQFFRETSYLGSSAKHVEIEMGKDELVEVPTSMIVGAEGFSSWLGKGEGTTKDVKTESIEETLSSLEAIKHYAGLQTEIPPVSEIRAFIQPDGTIFCDNGSGDSHRIAAAKLRGQATMQAEKIQFIQLNKNILPPDYATASQGYN